MVYLFSAYSYSQYQGIGLLAQFISRLESEQLKAHIERDTTAYETLLCVGQYAKNLSDPIRKMIMDSIDSDRCLQALEDFLFEFPFIRNFVETTKAVTIVEGGIKANALPENSWAAINHRIAVKR